MTSKKHILLTMISLLGLTGVSAQAADDTYMIRRQLCQFDPRGCGSPSGSTPPAGGEGTTEASLTISPTSSTGMNVIGPATEGALVTFTVRNTGTDASSAISTALSNVVDFEIGANTCSGALLAANATCTIGVRPVATSNGTFSATLVATAANGGSPSAILSGSASGFGPASLVADRDSISGMDVVGPATSGATETITVTNVGGAATTVLTHRQFPV